MAIQTTVQDDLAIGVVGEIQDSVPNIVDTYIVEGAGANVAYAFTLESEGKAQVGGTDTFIGIAINPKRYPNYNADLSANTEIRAGVNVELISKGRVLVDLGGAAAINSDVYFVNATGALGAGTATTGQTQIANTKVVKYTAGSNGIALIELGKVS